MITPETTWATLQMLNLVRKSSKVSLKTLEMGLKSKRRSCYKSMSKKWQISRKNFVFAWRLKSMKSRSAKTNISMSLWWTTSQPSERWRSTITILRERTWKSSSYCRRNLLTLKLRLPKMNLLFLNLRRVSKTCFRLWQTQSRKESFFSNRSRPLTKIKWAIETPKVVSRISKHAPRRLDRTKLLLMRSIKRLSKRNLRCIGSLKLQSTSYRAELTTRTSNSKRS